MIEPFTAACLYAVGEVAKGCTIEAVTGGIAGNVGDRLLCKITNETTRQFASKIVEPKNHDLLAGVMNAHVRALQFYAETLNQQATASDRPIADKIMHLAHKTLMPDERSIATLMDTVTPLLANPGDRQLDERRESFVSAAVTSLIESIENQIDEILPPRFKRLFRERADNGRESWQERFTLYLSETIKNESKYGNRFRNIFIASNLGEIAGRVITIQDLSLSMTRDLGVVQTRIESLQDDTSRILQLLEAKNAQSSEPKWPEPSSKLKALIEDAKIANKRHEREKTLQLWEQVANQALIEQNLSTQIEAKCKKAIALGQLENKVEEGLELVEECLALAQGVDLGSQRIDLDQSIGELYRMNGDTDRGRGFVRSALNEARSREQPISIAYALLSLSAFETDENLPLRETSFFEFIKEAEKTLENARANPKVDKKDLSIATADLRGWVADNSDAASARTNLNDAIKTLTSLDGETAVRLARAYTQRAEVSLSQGDYPSAEADFESAREQCEKIDYAIGLARIDASIAKHLMVTHELDRAERYQLRAIERLADVENERLTHPFWDQYAMIVLANRKQDLAKEIYRGIFETDWVKSKVKAHCAEQLKFIAEVEDDKASQRQWTTVCIDLLSREKAEVNDARELRRIEKRIARLMASNNQTSEAEKIYNRLLDCLDREADLGEIVELWSNLASLQQIKGDPEKERHYHEEILAAESVHKKNPMRLISLMMLAQLEMQDEKFAVAETLLNEAIAITPDHPMLLALIADLRNRFPKLSLNAGAGIRGETPSMGDRDLLELIEDLDDWIKEFPSQCGAILSVWYHVYRDQIWQGFGKIAGLKFLVLTEVLSSFKEIQPHFAKHADYIAWGTPFRFKTSEMKSLNDIEMVSIPHSLLIPPSVSMLGQKEGSEQEIDAHGKARIFGKRDSVRFGSLKEDMDFRSTAYHLTFIDEDGEARGIFFGAKRDWINPEIPDFMIGSTSSPFLNRESICLPVGDGESIPSLKRCLTICRENYAVPVFADGFPDTKGVRIVVESDIVLPAVNLDAQSLSNNVWFDLLDLAQSNPRKAIRDFAHGLNGLSSGDGGHLPLRLIIFEFEYENSQVSYPALQIQR